MTEPVADSLTVFSTSGPTDSLTKMTDLPSCFSSSLETGSREYLATTLPSGRPKWDIKMTLDAPVKTHIVRLSVDKNCGV